MKPNEKQGSTTGSPPDQREMARVRQMIAEGADQLDRDEGVDGWRVLEQLKAKHDRLLADRDHVS